MSDKLSILRNLYENSKQPHDKAAFDEIIELAELQGISTSVRSLKSYKKTYQWKPISRAKEPEKPEPLKNEKNKILKSKPTDVPVEPIEIIPSDPLNPVAYQQKLTEVMQFLLQGASKTKIYDHYIQKGEKISRANIDKLADEAYNIYASISPQQRETILGINYERLNMLFNKVIAEMGKNPKSTGYLAGQAVRIMSEINSMFGIKSINLNLNNMDGIHNKVNNMSDEEKMNRLLELTKKDNGTYGV